MGRSGGSGGRSGGSAGRSSGGSFGGSRSSGGRTGGSFGGGRSGGFGSSRGSSGPSRPSSVRPPSGGRRPGGVFGGGLFWPRRPVVVVPPPVIVNKGPAQSGGGGQPGSSPGGEPRKQAGGDSGSSGRSGCGVFGCSTVFVILAVILAIAVLASVRGSSLSGSNASGITWSTVKRQPLPAGSVNETAYFTDTLDWIGNPTKLVAGLKHFYQKTGVQPHLYITDTVAGSHYPAMGDLDDFARDLYDELFTDEAHLLLVFFEYDGVYMDRYVCGTQAKTVIDQEAGDILLDYLDRYYYQQGLSDEEYFSKSFSEAADRIMTVTRSPAIPVLVALGAVVFVAIVFVWWKEAKKQKAAEAQRTEAILKTPLERFGSTEVKELEKKYEDMGKQDGLGADSTREDEGDSSGVGNTGEDEGDSSDVGDAREDEEDGNPKDGEKPE